MEITQDPGDLASFMQARYLEYVYLGESGGPLSANMLRADTNFETVYQQGGVSIFRLLDY
jgi:hypothetical protein